MADASFDKSEEKKEDGEKKKKNILEEKSKEDLIKIVRKYLNLLQKAKNKADELTEKCSFLENEKNSAVKEHQSTEKELLNKIDVLQQHISELNADKPCPAENSELISELKKKLKDTCEENSRYTSSIRENEEQLQCLNSQLQTLKASCQCINGENIKLQELNKEKDNENALLIESKNALLSDFNRKVEECNSILSMKSEIEEKYENCAKDKQLLLTENKDCKKEVEYLRKFCTENYKVDFIGMINENMRLLKAVETFNHPAESMQCDPANIEYQKTIRETNQNVPNSVVDNSNPVSLESEAQISILKASLETLEENNKKLQLELDKYHIENIALKEQIKKIEPVYQLNDYKSGIELALLQGAPAESLIYPTELPSSGEEETRPNDSSKKKYQSSEDFINIHPDDEASGMEYALLQGGNMSSFIINNAFIGGSDNIQISEKNLVNQVSVPSCCEIALKENYYEIESLRQKLTEYSSLCEDTLDENKSLKKTVEELKSKSKDVNIDSKDKVFIHQEVNTDFDLTETKNEFISSGYEEKDEISSQSQENYIYLCKQIVNLYKNILCDAQNQILDLSENDPVKLLNEIEHFYEEVVNDLDKKSSELNECNLQLELLVIGIKQGVRQKTSATSYQTENKLEENMSLLKVLLDDLILRSNSYTSKLKNLESDASNRKKKMDEELLQLKELNQFLEVENRELLNEVEKLKCSFNAENSDNREYYGEGYQRSPELYSIDESSELDEKTDSNADVIVEALHPKREVICDIAMQTSSEFSDFAVQVESDLLLNETSSKEYKDASNNTDLENENLLIIEPLTKENESLKETIHEKSVLVEQIHCQMDSLLSKVEELNIEVKEKEGDLKHSQCLNADLKKMLVEVENIKKQQLDALKAAQASILEMKTKSNDLSDDVKSFSLSSEEFITNVNDSILNIIKQNCSDVNHYMEKCYHQEQNFNVVEEWLIEFTNDFECWFKIMDQMVHEASDEYLNLENFDLSELKRTFEAFPQNVPLFKAMCNENTCCLISKSIELLNSSKLKLFSKFYNHLNENYRFLVKDWDNYKVNIVPRIEKNISELEKKLSECTCQQSPKDIKNEEDNLQEKGCKESLKNQLADTETKMAKFKQIALKLKKELTQTKEQYNEVTSEKEKLQKQNAKLLDELNTVTEEQCTYAQNYQSLQNEFDKLQDDCEMHKDNIKKLEEDLTAKLLEFTASKEHVMELESQIKLSKQLLESNLSVKKELETKCADLESKVIILESKIDEKAQKINTLEMDVAKHLKDLSTAGEDNKKLKDQLELAQKEGKKKNLLDLEMADFERSITELNNQIQKKDDEIGEMQKEIKCVNEKYDSLQEEMKSTETLKETESKRAESLKEILGKTKAELHTVQNHETELLSKTASLQIRYETLAQQQEDYKLRLSEASAQILHLQEVIKTSSENHQRIVRSFEQRISNQKQDILIAHKEVESVKQEFENYKIRVHSVLKQQKTVTPAITTVDADLNEKLETMNEKLRLQVKDLSEKIIAMTLEYETLQEEHDTLLQRYNKAIDDREEKDKEWQQRLELINAEKNRLRATQEELSSHHLLQNEMLVATYKKQIKIMSEEHKQIVNDLQKQLDTADVEIARLQRDQQKQQGLPLTPLPQDSSPFDILSQERQEGEGSESTDETNTPVRHLSLSTIPTSGFLPFEKLIQSPLESGTPASFMSTHDSEKLTTDLNTANKRIDHLNELLNDSESTNLRMSEQVRVLKEEVRRLENNKEREQHAENLEYLKNVFIKFSSLQPGSEKAMLLPVLTTMLKLSANEQQQLKSVAGDMDGGDPSNSGWSSYLHRWSGLS